MHTGDVKCKQMYPSEKAREILRDRWNYSGFTLILGETRASTLRPAASRGYKKVRKRVTMVIPRCSNFAADQTLACCSLEAESFTACLVELAPCRNRHRTYCWLGRNLRFWAETRVIKGRKIACCAHVYADISRAFSHGENLTCTWIQQSTCVST